MESAKTLILKIPEKPERISMQSAIRFASVILITALSLQCSSGFSKVRYISVADIEQPQVASYRNTGILTNKVCWPLKSESSSNQAIDTTVFILGFFFPPIWLYFLTKASVNTKSISFVEYVDGYSQGINGKARLTKQEGEALKSSLETDLVVKIGERQFFEKNEQGIEMGCSLLKMQGLEVVGLNPKLLVEETTDNKKSTKKENKK